MSAAQDTVISSPELVELILAHLPMRDLLVTAPRVSKMWNATTLTPPLQRVLFFQPDPSDWRPLRNPLLMELFPPFFAPKGPRGRWPGDAESIAKMPWANATQAFRHPDASWRRMLIVQPPAATLIVTQISHWQEGDFQSQETVNYDDTSSPGLRMGPLYDLAVPLIDRPASSFYVSWPGHDTVPCEHELTLMACYTMQCTGGRRVLDRRFRIDGPGESVELVESDDSEEE
ncbi:hypothetical protein C8F04DRAFT_1032288 [Mycena alexandri]|uniref:F-box domain-containing protein n=1 Tax=Mycena alexandri TaxID=1745969 RepID=A0AAD6X8F6_9AGAR|nr:hypothetical protein C8F04DRAFT_1032288 [Mycena alexandri]